MRSGDVGEAAVEFERDPPFRHIEGEFTEGAVIVFPAALFLLEIAVAELFDRLAQADVVGPDQFVCRLGIVE